MRASADVSRSIFQVFQACAGGVPTKGLFYPPTLITNVQTVSTVVVEEVRYCTHNTM